MMTTAPPCRNQCFRQTGPVISEITGLDSAAGVWLVIVSDLSYISSDHYTLFKATQLKTFYVFHFNGHILIHEKLPMNLFYYFQSDHYPKIPIT